MFPEKPLLAIFAHPDDESFLAGGALAMTAKKTGVRIVIATAGEKGRSHIDYKISDEDIAKVRKEETSNAMQALGVKDYTILDYPDGALDNVDEEEIVTRLSGFIREFNPSSILTFGPDGVTGHRDHIAIGRFATKAAAMIGKQVFWLARPAAQHNLVESRSWKRTKQFYGEIPEAPYKESELICIDVSPVLEQKKKAIAAHASQGTDRYLVPEADGLVRVEYYYKVKNIEKGFGMAKGFSPFKRDKKTRDF
ncbi:MAG: PIG-L family deacetylase [Candidatus Aenigmarchaeota archaeon]|nr:PIG-L family deacetylase [Candidatus Aenigmarchaeota archaeon]